MKNIIFIFAAIGLTACQSSLYGTYPETRISYKQDGKSCVYTEEYGEWTYSVDFNKMPENEYFIIANKRQVIFENTDCSKVIEAHLEKDRDVYSNYKIERPVHIEKLN